jgi:hypothetical protein
VYIIPVHIQLFCIMPVNIVLPSTSRSLKNSAPPGLFATIMYTLFFYIKTFFVRYSWALKYDFMFDNSRYFAQV